MAIHLADEYGPVLLGRTSGEEIRAKARSALANGQTVVLDFKGVEEVSPSFADEVFAKLPDEAGREAATERLQFANLADDLRVAAKFVIDNRRGNS